MSNLPFPNDNHAQGIPVQGIRKMEKKKPWEVIRTSEHPPMMFTISSREGVETSYAYSDLREIRLIDNGHLQLCVFGFEKYLISITGRHLRKLAELLNTGQAKVIREFDTPFLYTEEEPAIDKIELETLTGPAY